MNNLQLNTIKEIVKLQNKIVIDFDNNDVNNFIFNILPNCEIDAVREIVKLVNCNKIHSIAEIISLTPSLSRALKYKAYDRDDDYKNYESSYDYAKKTLCDYYNKKNINIVIEIMSYISDYSTCKDIYSLLCVYPYFWENTAYLIKFRELSKQYYDYCESRLNLDKAFYTSKTIRDKKKIVEKINEQLYCINIYIKNLFNKFEELQKNDSMNEIKKSITSSNKADPTKTITTIGKK